VRNMGAGLACPDWPLCHGKIIPPFDLLVLIEWGHRLLASVVGFVTLGICILVLVKKKHRKLLGTISVMALFLVTLQAVLGGMTVLDLLGPQWVSSHLAVGLIFFATILWMYLRKTHNQNMTALSDSGEGRHYLVLIVGMTTLLIYCQAVLGAWVASTGAGLACPDFPTCFGVWVPPLNGLVKYQFFHRVNALLVVSVVAGLFFLSRSGRLGSTLHRWMGVVLGMTLLQVMLGIGNVWFKLPKLMSIAHLLMATLLFAMMVTITYKVKHAELS